MATWARGVDFKNSTNTTRVGGIGIYGTDATTNKLYIGLGAEPWNNAGLQLTSSAINFKGNKIYHAGDKPTASEIGAAAASHTHNYIPLSGSTGVTGTLRSNSEIQTTSQNAFRAVSGNYGFFIRNDGSNTWFMLTKSGDQYGSYNSLRPISINNSSGLVSFGNGLKGTLDGNASTATTLQNARTINDVSFNGSSNITIPLKTFVSNVSNDNTKNYHRILSSGVVTGSYADKTIILMGSGNYSGGPFGIFKVILRTNASGSNSTCNIEWMVRKGFGLDSIVCNMINTYGSTVADIFYKCAGTYAAINWTVLFENNGRGGSYNNGSWTKYTTNASGTEAYTETEMKALRSYTSTLAQGSDTTVVNSANKLASRRTLTIGSTGKTFDGTSNVSWNLSEIGAAASSHTHNYAGSSSAGGAANSATVLATARTINGTSFNGSANITTANWGTARTITVGSTAKSVNGSANIGWTLAEIGAVPSYTGGSTTIHADSDASSTSEYLLLKAGHNELKIASSAGGTTVTKGQDKLTFNGNIVYHAGRKPTASEIGAAASSHTHSYLPLSGGTMTGALTSSVTTGTHLAGNKGTAIINSTATGSSYNMLAKMNSTNGVWTMGSWGTSFCVFYTANSIINAGTNSYTNRLTLLDESGNSSFPGTVTASKSLNSETINATSTIATNGGINAKGTITGHTIKATNGMSVAGSEICAGKTSAGSYFNRVPVIGSDGAVEVGRFMDWHYSGTENKDYHLRLEVPDWNCLFVNGGLRVTSTFYPNSNGGIDVGQSGTRFRTVYCTTVNQSSDKKFKEDIVYLDDVPTTYSNRNTNTNIFKKFITDDLKIASYKFIQPEARTINEDENCPFEQGPKPWDNQIGFIAQDVYETEVGKHFVYEENGDYSFSPSGFTTVIAKALQEEIRERDEQINSLKEQNQMLLDRLAIIEEKLGLQ